MSARVELRRLTETAVWAPTTGAGRTGRGGDRQPRYSGRGSGSGSGGTTTPRSQHGTAGSGPHLRGSPTLKRAEPTYGRSRPWPVSRVVRPSTWGWTSTRTRSRWGSCQPTSRSQMSSGSPMTRHRSAGSPAASATPACCEPATSTGPTGFELARLLHSMGISCQVIAPSLIPKAPGRQGPRPTGAITGGSPRLHRAGELVAIRIPTVQEEAVRDLCRTSVDMVQDLTRARNRLGKFLLRHGRVWRAGRPGRSPTRRGLAPSGSTSPPWPRRSATTWPWSRSVTRNPTPWRPTLPAGAIGRRWTRLVARLAAYRGVTRLGALRLAAPGR